MDLDFFLQNVYRICVCMHFKIKKFVKICIKNTLSFKLRVSINVFANFPLITSGKHIKNYMLSLELQRIA